MVTVRLPASLSHGSDTMQIQEPLRSVSELIAALDRRLPGFAQNVDEAMFNFAVNDELILQGVNAHPLKDGDHVEIVPTISGG
jgi:molybdopterin converting factor small subunit